MFEKLTSAHEIDPTVAWNMQFQELKVKPVATVRNTTGLNKTFG